MSLAVRRADAREIAAHWATVMPLFASALDRDPVRRFEPIDLFQLIISQHFTAWIAVDTEGEIYAVMLTDFISYPRIKSCNAFLVAGDGLGEWGPLFMAAAEQHARENGCGVLEGEGRHGWLSMPGVERGGTRMYKVLR